MVCIACALFMQTDLKGKLPTSIVNMVCRDQPLVLATLKKLLDKAVTSGTPKRALDAPVDYEGACNAQPNIIHPPPPTPHPHEQLPLNRMVSSWLIFPNSNILFNAYLFCIVILSAPRIPPSLPPPTHTHLHPHLHSYSTLKSSG